MKTNIATLLHWAVLGLLLNAVCTLVSQPAQAQGMDQEHRRVPIPPQAYKASRDSLRLAKTAAASLHAGHYAQAEAESRQALSIDPFDGVAQEVLAAALDAQGQEQEAFQLYHVIVVDQKDDQPRNLVPYALLLLKSGQWEQAVAVYNQALPHLGDKELTDLGYADLIQATRHFSPDVPQPVALAAALHIARGLTYSGQCGWADAPQNTEALAEFGKALQLAPYSPLANYYYGSGWQQLSPAERARIGSFQQAKAALQKAILLGKGDLKKAAQKALKDLNKPANKPA